MRLLSILVGIMFPKRRACGPDNDKGYDRKSRSRNRLSRAARPACPHHARVARHVAQGAGKSLRHFRTLYRPARKRQGQRLDRAAAPGVERDGRASRRPDSRDRTRARLARDPRPPAQGDAGPDRAGQGGAVRPGPRRISASDVVFRHRPDRPARRRQIHPRQDAGEEDRLELCRAQQGDRARRTDCRSPRSSRSTARKVFAAWSRPRSANCWRARN